MPRKTKSAVEQKQKPFPHELPDNAFFEGVKCTNMAKPNRGRNSFRLLLGEFVVRLIYKGRSYKLLFNRYARRNQISTGVKTEAGGLEYAVCWLREQNRSTPPPAKSAKSAIR
jgi:hypothetical protein